MNVTSSFTPVFHTFLLRNSSSLACLPLMKYSENSPGVGNDDCKAHNCESRANDAEEKRGPRVREANRRGLRVQREKVNEPIASGS